MEKLPIVKPKMKKKIEKKMCKLNVIVEIGNQIMRICLDCSEE